MSVLREYEEFHKLHNICTECHGKGYKRVVSPYKRNNKWYYDVYKKYRCKKCNGSGKYSN